MKYPGFCGPTYESSSVVADGQRCINLYPEIIESGAGKNLFALFATPGLVEYDTVGTGPIRALHRTDENRERVLVVSGAELWELFSDKTATKLGDLNGSSEPASIAYSGSQYMIVSGTDGYILADTTLTRITDADFPGATHVAFFDGYFVIVEPQSQKLWVSKLYDGTIWNALDFTSVEARADRVKTIVVDHDALWVFGSEVGQVYYNSGDPDFPFDPIQGAVIEQGLDAPWSVARIQNSQCWLGGDSRGRGVVFRSEQYSPQRISNHAIENAIRDYTTTDDAIGWGYLDDGHWFYVLYFPTANATWVYDATTNQWHERGVYNGFTGLFDAHWSRCHVFAFNRHLVGSRIDGKVYEQSLSKYDDDGTETRRIRRAPHLTHDHKWIFYHEFVLDLETGVGLPTGQGSDPQIGLRYSDDGGRTWSAENSVTAGAIGDYSTRVRWARLGRARDRVFEVSMADPVKWALVNAYLNVSLGA
jgi:hypothetical protein